MKRNFKKTVSLILAVLMVMAVVPFGGMAAEGECDHDYKYTSYGSDKHIVECKNCDDVFYREPCDGPAATSCGAKAKCDKCKAEFGTALPHDFYDEDDADMYIKSEGDCQTKKTYYKSCAVCGALPENLEDAAYFVGEEYGDHVFTTYEAKGDATCTNPGHKVAVCDVCEEETDEIDADETSKLPHNYVDVVDEKYLISAATCTANGVYYKSCEDCGAQGAETFTTDKIDHVFAAIENPEENALLKSAATCSKPAVYYMSCTVCFVTAKAAKAEDKVFTYGEPHDKPTEKTEVVKPAEADESKYLILNADCLNDAIYSMLCKRCGEPMAKTVDEAKTEDLHFYWKPGTATNPDHRDIKDMTETQKAVDATCTEAAIPAIYKCPKDGCGAVVERYPENAAFDEETKKSIPLGHTFDKTKSKAYVEPGCVTEGEYAEETCSVCKTTLYFDKDGTERTLTYITLNPIKNLGGHKDANGDEWCDNCEIHVTAQDTCTCICHQSGGLMYFVALILKWFWKLTGTKPTCPAPCGMAHY